MASALRYSKRWHDVAYWALLLMACAVMMVMNVLTTFKEDDLAFTLIESEWTPVRSLADMLHSHVIHYTGTNGRLAELVPELFACLLGKTAFNVCNAIVFALLAHLISLLATGRRSLLAVSAFLAIVGTCYPIPGETMLWMAGSANYMWAITLSLALVYYLTRSHSRPLGWAGAVLLFVVSLLAGGFNEATSMGFLGGMVLYYACNRSLIDRRVVVALVAYLIGLLLIVASPGAWNRAATDVATDMSVTSLIASRWHIFSEKMWRFYLPVFAAVTGVCLLVMGKGRAVRRCVWTYVFVCLAAVLFVLGLHHERPYAPLVTVASIILLMVADALLSGKTLWRVAVTVVALGLTAFTYGRGIEVLKAYKAFDDEVTAQIQASPSQVVLRERQFDQYSRFVMPMLYMSTNYFDHEVIYRAYFGKENVQFVDDSVYTRYHEDRLLDGASVWPIGTRNPDLSGDVLRLQGQDYMAVTLRLDTLPATYQTARYYFDDVTRALSDEELSRRQQDGLTLTYNPMGFFPLRYRGQCYLILPVPDSSITRIDIPLDITQQPVILTLLPQAK